MSITDPAATLRRLHQCQPQRLKIPDPPLLPDAPQTYAALCRGLAQLDAAQAAQCRAAEELAEQVAATVSRFIAIDDGRP